MQTYLFAKVGELDPAKYSLNEKEDDLKAKNQL